MVERIALPTFLWAYIVDSSYRCTPMQRLVSLSRLSPMVSRTTGGILAMIVFADPHSRVQDRVPRSSTTSSGRR